MSPTSEHGYFRNVLLSPYFGAEAEGTGGSVGREVFGGGGAEAMRMAEAIPISGPMPSVPVGPPVIERFMGLTNQELVGRYAKGVEAFDRRVLDLTASQADTAFLPEAGVGRWPVRVLIGHLADAELVFVHRMRRSVAEDNPLLAVFDEQAFIDSGLYGVVATEPGRPVAVPAHTPAIGGFIAVIHTLRKWTTEWLSGLSPKQWERACLHPERGPLTVRKIAEYDTWHLEHHAWYLNRKVGRLLGEARA